MISFDKKCSLDPLALPMDLTLEWVCGITGGLIVLESLRNQDLKTVRKLVQQAALLVFGSEVLFHYRYIGLKPVPLYGRVFLIGEAFQLSLESGIKLAKLCFRLKRDEDTEFEVELPHEVSLRELKEILCLSSRVALLVITIGILDTLEGVLEYRRTLGGLDFL